MLNNRELTYLPHWLCDRALIFFGISFAVCTLLFFAYAMEVRYALTSILSVLLFFGLGQTLSKRWVVKDERKFAKAIFYCGFLIRVCWAIYIYYFNISFYGQPYGDGADVEWYMPAAKACVDAIKSGNFHIWEVLRVEWMAAVDDTGYPLFLMLEYFFLGNMSDVFVPYLIKSALSACCAVFMYRVARAHFGEGVGRITAFFVMLNPNMIYWCGSMMKETEMVFLTCWFIYLMDSVLSSNKITVARVFPAALVGMSLFLFRSALGLVGFAAVLMSVVLTSQRVFSWGKKVFAGVMVAGLLLIGMGDNLRTQTERVVQSIQSNEQTGNMQWRAERKDASGRQNKLIAKYATATVFAPLVFTIPFPTFNQANEGQTLQPMLSGGSYIKNILSFFVVLVMFILLFSGKWRQHVFIIAFTCGYLAALVFSNFAHSGRFHMPAIPMLMMFAAYGISLANQNSNYKRWFLYVCFIEVAACVVWNWFKLAGRGMI